MYIMIPAGFEPATVRLEGECSIQLSYETDTFSFYQKNLVSSRFTYGKDFPVESWKHGKSALPKQGASVDGAGSIFQNSSVD